MKAFRIICAMIILAIAIFSIYHTIGNVSISPYCFVGMIFICFILVITDGLKSKKHD